MGGDGTLSLRLELPESCVGQLTSKYSLCKPPHHLHQPAYLGVKS